MKKFHVYQKNVSWVT